MASTTTKKVTTRAAGDPPEPEVDRWLEIFSIFVHDLEAPIASVKYLLGLLSEGRFDPENHLHSRLVDSSQIAVDRAEAILYDIMAVARSGSAGLPVSLATLDPAPIVTEAVQLIQGAAAENRVTVGIRGKIDPVPVQADRKLLLRVLDNLLYNALRHTPSQGQIEVYTEAAARSLFIHVRDGGRGLGDIEPEKLFEKYGQVSLRADGQHRGVGLGLYFCKLAATGMGGTILADDHEAGGAVFSIKLKKANAQEGTDEA